MDTLRPECFPHANKQRSLSRALKAVFDSSAERTGQETPSALVKRPPPQLSSGLSVLLLLQDEPRGPGKTFEAYKHLPSSPPTPAVSELYRLPAFTLSQFYLDRFKYRDLSAEAPPRPVKEQSAWPDAPPSIGKAPCQNGRLHAEDDGVRMDAFQPYAAQKIRPTPVQSVRRNRLSDFTLISPEIHTVPTVSCHIVFPNIEQPRRVLRKVECKNDLRACDDNSLNRSTHEHVATTKCSDFRAEHLSTHSAKSTLSIYAVNHFQTFCILDSDRVGTPVILTTANLGQFSQPQKAEQMFLNIQHGKEDQCDFVTDVNELGEFIYYLVLFGALYPAAGKDRYMLASLVDVSDMVDAILEDSIAFPATEDEPKVEDHDEDENEDVWLALAKAESTKVRRDEGTISFLEAAIQETQALYSTLTPKEQKPRASRSPTTSADQVLADFMVNMQKTYRDYFCLTRSQLNDEYYEISLVSPSLRESGDYLNGHLSHTDPDVLEALGRSLGRGENFSTSIMWGIRAVEKRLYCTPLFGEELITWVCMMVDGSWPSMWRI